MKAYRFNDVEMSRLTWLKQCFNSNGFDFTGLRHPEVYYADFNELDMPIKSQEKIKNDILPDYFGVYQYQCKYTDNESILNAESPFESSSQEGRIILFKDRIEEFCNKRNLLVDNVNFVVLMHEWGHWVTHWPKYRKFNWHKGFHRPLTMTKEGLAQLIAFWACGNDLQLHETLKCLTPQFNGAIDATNPYGVYAKLIERSMQDIIQKIGQLRKVWFINDEKMLEFLLAEEVDLMKWVVSNNYNLESVSMFGEMDFTGISDDENNLDAEIMRHFFSSSELSSGNRMVNRMCSTNYEN